MPASSEQRPRPGARTCASDHQSENGDRCRGRSSRGSPVGGRHRGALCHGHGARPPGPGHWGDDGSALRRTGQAPPRPRSALRRRGGIPARRVSRARTVRPVRLPPRRASLVHPPRRLAPRRRAWAGPCCPRPRRRVRPLRAGGQGCEDRAAAAGNRIQRSHRLQRAWLTSGQHHPCSCAERQDPGRQRPVLPSRAAGAGPGHHSGRRHHRCCGANSCCWRAVSTRPMRWPKPS